jgi:hypothetical protein
MMGAGGYVINAADIRITHIFGNVEVDGRAT